MYLKQFKQRKIEINTLNKFYKVYDNQAVISFVKNTLCT